MKKIIKLISFITSSLIIILIVFITYSFFNHQKQISLDEELLKKYNTGSTIEIDGLSLNYKIFNSSNEENTILFLQGSGATDLSLSLLPLSQKINAKIILINRPGYGNSSDTTKKADIDYIVNLYRKALEYLNIDEKIILMPHSISGMYAIYWSSLYPEQIKSIVGLDIGSPFLYLESPNDNSIDLLYLASKLGFQRHTWLLDLIGYKTAIINYDTYDQTYFAAITAMNNIRPISHFNISEEKNTKKNAQIAIDSINDNYKSIKKLYIQANTIEGTFYDTYIYQDIKKYYKSNDKIEEYKQNVREYATKEKESLNLDDQTIFQSIEGPHCLYYYPKEDLVNAINNFIQE